MQADAFCSRAIYRDVFFETKHFIAIYNRRPILPGHTLIVPKRHVTRIVSLTSDEMLELRDMLRKLLPKLLKTYGADAYNLNTNAGENAGMVINHLHFHLVPRTANDVFHGKIDLFYRALEDGIAKNSRSVHHEVKRLRKIFRYKPREREE